MKKTTRCFVISLIVLILCSLLNWGVVTGWGDVKVRQVQVIGDNGLTYGALMYVPKSATNENPAPLFLNAHGNTGNARNQEAWSVELARRGFVVLSCDNYGSGDGEYIDGDETSIPELFCSYAMALPIVNEKLFVTAGHSRGTTVANRLAIKYQATAMLEICAAGKMKPDQYTGNVLVVSGTADRSASLEKILTQTLNDFNVTGAELESVEIGKLYGSFEDRTAKQLTYVDGMLHEGALINDEAIEAILDFSMQSIGVENVPNYISGDNQVWRWKDIVGLIGMCAFLWFILVLTVWMIDVVPFFERICQPIPRNIGLRGKGFALSLAAAVVFPLIVLYTGTFGLNTLLGTNNISLFSMQMGNRAFSTVVGINLMGLIMLFLFAKVDGKKQQAKLCDYGLTCEGENKLSFALIGRSFLLAAFVLFIAFTYLELQQNMLGTEFYCQFWGFRPIALTKLKHYIPYIVVWILCFIVAAIGLNVERRLPTVGNERADMVIALVFNTIVSCFTITAMVLIQIAVQKTMGAGSKVMTNWSVDMTRLWGMPFGMAAAGFGQTYLYRKTGSVWTGVFVMGVLCALTCVLYAQYKIVL